MPVAGGLIHVCVFIRVDSDGNHQEGVPTVVRPGVPRERNLIEMLVKIARLEGLDAEPDPSNRRPCGDVETEGLVRCDIPVRG